MYTTPGYNGGNTPLCPNSSSSIQGQLPKISSFSPSVPAVAAGQPVTLSWNVTGASTRLRFVTPNVGTVVTDSVTVRPTKTTTYTLMTQNLYGRSTASVTVYVGQTPPQMATMYVGVKLDTFPNVAKVRVNLIDSNTAVTPTDCSASPCLVPIDLARSGYRLRLDYLSAAGDIMSSSSPFSIRTK
jgi:hypothetical protein